MRKVSVVEEVDEEACKTLILILQEIKPCILKEEEVIKTWVVHMFLHQTEDMNIP